MIMDLALQCNAKVVLSIAKQEMLVMREVKNTETKLPVSCRHGALVAH